MMLLEMLMLHRRILPVFPGQPNSRPRKIRGAA